jgi:hypothetical protein
VVENDEIVEVQDENLILPLRSEYRVIGRKWRGFVE